LDGHAVAAGPAGGPGAVQVAEQRFPKPLGGAIAGRRRALGGRGFRARGAEAGGFTHGATSLGRRLSNDSAPFEAKGPRKNSEDPEKARFWRTSSRRAAPPPTQG